MSRLLIIQHRMFTEKRVWKCVSLIEWGLSCGGDAISAEALSVNKIFVYRSWFRISQLQIFSRAKYLFGCRTWTFWMRNRNHYHARFSKLSSVWPRLNRKLRTLILWMLCTVSSTSSCHRPHQHCVLVVFREFTNFSEASVERSPVWNTTFMEPPLKFLDCCCCITITVNIHEVNIWRLFGTKCSHYKAVDAFNT
jgi:hypothetical protein